jgi:hypothetical protein
MEIMCPAAGPFAACWPASPVILDFLVSGVGTQSRCDGRVDRVVVVSYDHHHDDTGGALACTVTFSDRLGFLLAIRSSLHLLVLVRFLAFTL